MYNTTWAGAGHLVPGQLARAGEEHHRGRPDQPQAQHSLYRGQCSEETHYTILEKIRRSTSTGCT